MNVTYLYPSEFDPSFTFFGYAVLILGGFASYGGVVVGALVLCALTEGLRFLDLPLSASQAGSLRFIIVGLILIMPQHVPAARPARLARPRCSLRS